MNRLLLIVPIIMVSLHASSVGSGEEDKAGGEGVGEQAPRTREELEQEVVVVRAERDLLKSTVARLRAELKEVKDATGATEKEKQARRAAALMAEKAAKSENKAVAAQMGAAKAVEKVEATLDVWKRRALLARDMANERGVMINDLLGRITALEARVDASEEIVAQLKGIRAAAGRAARGVDRIADELRDLNWELRTRY